MNNRQIETLIRVLQRLGEQVAVLRMDLRLVQAKREIQIKGLMDRYEATFAPPARKN